MKLFPQQPPFEIYKTGFGGDDLLNRSTSGQRLSELLERVEDPVVLALDGPWGSGKSYFLKRWVGAHTVENKGRATTVYFDAFANDFLDDPLIALIGAIGDRLPKDERSAQWKSIKKYAAILAKPALRIGVAAATSGISELAGPIVDAAADKLGKEFEEAAETFWKKEDGRKAAMQQFQASLTKLTAPSQPDLNDETPLIVVIDELDRCRPDYALSILEVIKHFFSVPHVHFILGVNIKALEHSVRSRYGQGINATDYLKRFISVTMRLPDFVDNDRSNRAALAYFVKAARDMGIAEHTIELFVRQLKLACESNQVSLRDVEKILTRIVLLPEANRMNNFYQGYQIAIASLVLFEVMAPDLYEDTIKRQTNSSHIRQFFGITGEMLDKSRERREYYNHDAYILNGVWRFLVDGSVDDEDFQSTFDTFRSTTPRQAMKTIETQFLSIIAFDT